MIIFANVQGMRSAVNAVASVVPTNSPKPILTCLLLEATEAGCTISATDLEVGIKYTVSGVRVDQPGSVVLPTARFRQLLGLIKDESVAIEIEGDKIVVKSTKGKWQFLSEDAALFPQVPPFEGNSYMIEDCNAMSVAIDRTIFATDTDSTRYALGGVCFDYSDKDFVALIATDGRRLACQRMVPEDHGDPAFFKQLVPNKALKALKGLVNDGGSVHYYFTDKAFYARTERAILHTRLVEGRFPRWEDVIPPSNLELVVSAGELFQTVRQAGITTSEDSQAVELQIDATGVCKACSKSEIGSTAVEMKMEWRSGEKSMAISFSGRFLTDGLAQMAGHVELVLNDEKSAAMFVTPDGYRYVVMPLTKEA